MLEQFSVRLYPEDLPAVGAGAAAVLVWKREVWAAGCTPEPGSDVVVASLGGRVEVMGTVRRRRGWSRRSVRSQAAH